jgi:small conductance mechanosensitive channel
VGRAVVSAVGRLAALVEFAGTRERLAVTAVVVVLTVLLALLLPPVLGRGVAVLRRRFSEADIGDQLERGSAAVGVEWEMASWAVTRLLQVGVLGVAGVALLVLWGRVGTALFVVTVVAAAFPYAAKLAVTVVLLAGAVVLTRLLQTRLDAYVEDSEHLNRHQQGVAFRVGQVVVFVAVGLAALSLWEVDLGGLLVGAGFLGIVVGMAARQTLGSLIAGFVLMFARPFEIGDWVAIGDHEGIVTDITIVNTRIRNFDDETVILPNDSVSNATVVNRTKRNRLRLRARVGIDYDADVERAEAVAEEAIQSVDRVMRVPAPQVVPVSFGDSAVTLELRFWIDKPSARRRWQARAGVIRAVKAAFEEAGIKIPFPQRELSGRAETDGFRVRDGEAAERTAESPPEN